MNAATILTLLNVTLKLAEGMPELLESLRALRDTVINGEDPTPAQQAALLRHLLDLERTRSAAGPA
ncbi:hypothetical protein [Roseospirillum parvum]|uniref:Uncharacterized protein n=1 Tax=Roseospirillum parvum TaxID=83401 RepID=A0A1G8EYM9_9PROT|nr:hypothetical protein [Roseospirillum parvum]SDH74954.1 hypothetical protein SAMN05421742_11181 [Roseospirillum parvum]